MNILCMRDGTLDGRGWVNVGSANGTPVANSKQRQPWMHNLVLFSFHLSPYQVGNLEASSWSQRQCAVLKQHLYQLIKAMMTT